MHSEQNESSIVAKAEGLNAALRMHAADDGANRLLQLATVADKLKCDPVAEEARELAARVSEGRFYVACVGQFKRGKSTLINALIGEPVLPTGYIPVTAVPTVIRFGKDTRARIRTSNAAWLDIPISDLKLYVTEELNPENKKSVQGAEVFVDSPFLSSGMCFVDTPGLGSVFTENTAATQAFIPHIDAALVVVGADPPLAGEELALVEDVGRQVQNLILVLNKSDRTTDAERTAAAAFTRQILQKHLQREVGPIFQVSAQERAENRGPQRDWKQLADTLRFLVDSSGRQLVCTACERGLQRLSEQLLATIGENRDALRRPIEQSEHRITSLKQTVAEAERSMRELSFLLMAEQQRLSDVFVNRHKAFTATALPAARREFQDSLRSIPAELGPAYRRRIMRSAQGIVREHVVPWLRQEQEEAEREYRSLALRFVDMGNEFLSKLGQAGIPELARMPRALDIETGLRVRSTFTFHDFIEVAQPASPLRWLGDLLLGLVGARKLIQNSGVAFLDHLLETNSTRVQSDTLSRVQDSRARLEVEIRKLLHEVSRMAEQALNRARKVKEEGEPVVEAELNCLSQLEAMITALR